MALDPIPDELKDLKKSESVLIIIKLKWNLIKGSCICQIGLPSHIPSAYLKSDKKFQEDISITKDISSEDMLRICDINNDIQGENDSVTEKIIYDGG